MKKKSLAFALLSCMFFLMHSSHQNFDAWQQHPMVQVIVPNSSSSSSQALNSSASQSLNNNLNKLNITTIQKTAVDINNKIMNSIKQMNVSKMLSTWQQHIKTCGNDATKRILGFFELMYDHKFKLMAVVIGMAYGYLFFTAQKTNRYLYDDCLWSSWKKELPLEQLLSIPQKELAQELLDDIKTYYIDTNEPTNFLSPLATFIQETDAELIELKRCASFSSWVLWLKLSKLLPFDIQKKEIARERTQRLMYLKNLFSSWIAQYKLTSNVPKETFPVRID